MLKTAPDRYLPPPREGSCGKSVRIVFAAAAVLAMLLLPQATAAQEAAIYTVRMSYELNNTGANEALNVRATVYLFDNISGWADQRVLSEEIRLDGAPIFPQIFEGEENRWTVIDAGNLKPGEGKTISVIQVVEVRSVDLSIEPTKVGSEFPPELREFTEPVPGLFESDDPRIQELATQLVSGITNPYLRLRRILKYVAENLVYERQTEEHGALWALLHGRGDCTEFSNLMIALARAAGIPAKAVMGYAYLPIYGTDDSEERVGHEYAIFYLPGYGWVPGDAVWPRYEGTLGKNDQYKIAGTVTDGRGVVDESGRISWAGPGYLRREWNYVAGRPTEVSGKTDVEIVPEVLVTVDVNVAGAIEDDMLPLNITLKNEGRCPVENLVIAIDAEEGKFQIAQQPPSVGRLDGGEKISLNHSVGVLENGYGASSVLVSTVTFDPVYPGMKGFSSSGSVTINIPPKPELPPEVGDPLLLLGIGVCAIAIAIGLVIAIKR